MGKFGMRNQGAAMLSEEQVRAIRRTKAEDPRMTYREIANHYGVASETVARVVRGDTWRNVRREPTEAEMLASQERLLAGLKRDGVEVQQRGAPLGGTVVLPNGALLAVLPQEEGAGQGVLDRMLTEASAKREELAKPDKQLDELLGGRPKT